MILLTRLNGTQVGLNPDLIERVEASGDTVVSLIDGTKYVVTESCADIVDRVVEFRARVLAAADTELDELAYAAAPRDRSVPRAETGPLRLVVEHDESLDPDGTRAGGH